MARALRREPIANGARRACRIADVEDQLIFTRLVNFCWSLFQWCLLLAVVAGVAIGAYLYFRLDDEIRRQVEHRLSTHYQDLKVHVGAARFEQDSCIAIYDVTIAAPRSDGGSEPLLTIDEMLLKGKVRLEQLVTSHLPIEQIVVRRATLRAARDVAGRWNVQPLLPLPQFSEETPEIAIEDASIYVTDAAHRTASQQIRGVDLTLSPLDEGADGPKRFRVAGTAAGLPAREVVLKGDLCPENGQLQMDVTLNHLNITEQLFATVPLKSMLGLQDAKLAGLADVEVQLRRASANDNLDWNVSLQVRHGRLAHRLLSDEVQNLTIDAQVDNARLKIDRLSCNYSGATLTAAGERRGWNAHAPCALAARIIDFPLDHRFGGQLPEPIADVWERFAPVGLVNAQLRVTYDGQRWQPHLVADCRDLTLTDKAKFAYSLQHCAGRLEYLPASDKASDKLQLHLIGFGAGRPIHVDAELTNLTRTPPAMRDADMHQVTRGQSVATDAVRHPVGWVQVSGSAIPLHEELYAAMPPKAEHLVRSLSAEGNVDFTFRAEWKDALSPRADVTQQIRLKDCSLCYSRFPYPLRQVRGLIRARNNQWTIDGVQALGASDSTIVTCRGTCSIEDESCRTALEFEALDLPLDEHLKMAVSPAVQQAWMQLNPQGRVNLKVSVAHDSNSPRAAISMSLRPHGKSVSLELQEFPYRFDEVEGVVHYRNGIVEINDIAARHGDSSYGVSSGVWQPVSATGGWQLNLLGVYVDRLMLERELVGAMPQQLQQAVERLQPAGRFAVYDSNLTIVRSPRSPVLEAAWDIHLDCHQARLGTQLPIKGIEGAVHLTGRRNHSSQHTTGELKLDSMIWRDVQFTNVRGPFWIDPVGCYFGDPAAARRQESPQRLTADTYGGSIAVNFETTHADAPEYKLDLALGAADLARFAKERLGGPEDMNGSVSGRLVLTGKGLSTSNMEGLGELKVVDANIYKLPVLVSMLKVLRNRTPDTTAFNRCDMQFTIKENEIQFQQIDLLGDAVSLYGKGQTDFTKKLDLVFYTMPEPANLPIPLWKTVAGHLSQQTLQLKVVGTWDHADVQPQTLPGVNHMLEQLQEGAATMAPATATRDRPLAPR